VPAGAAALWLQLQEVPQAPRSDPAGELDTTMAGPRRWPRDMPTAYWTGSRGTPPICATKSARSTSWRRTTCATVTATPSTAIRTAAPPSWTRAFCGGLWPRRAATRPRSAGSGTSALRPTREQVSAVSPDISSRPLW